MSEVKSTKDYLVKMPPELWKKIQAYQMEEPVDWTDGRKMSFNRIIIKAIEQFFNTNHKTK
jgi:hypothetical protein